ncbi:MAG: general secretion pathway protein GspE [Deltaproteobacteria bacterium]|nr:general secretion pathway protein GspE [Deltaproteobacteria bacterium]
MAIRLGELLLKANVITEAQLKAALDEQKRWGGKLGEILVRMTFVTEDLMVKALAKQLGVTRVDLDPLPPVPKPVLHRIPHEVARDLQSVALQLKDDKTLVVAMAEPTNLEQLDTLQKVSRCKISPVIATPTQIARLIARSYEDSDSGSLDSDSGEGFKVVDAQGKTVVKSIAELEARGAAAHAPKGPAPRPAAPPPGSPGVAAPAQTGASVMLTHIEEAQRKEVAALKAMVELLIEKGVFSREEYLARVRR